MSKGEKGKERSVCFTMFLQDHSSAMTTLNYPGPFCEHAGILCDALTSDSSDFPVLSEGDIVKGIALELRQFQVENDLSLENLYGRITRL